MASCCCSLRRHGHGGPDTELEEGGRKEREGRRGNRSRFRGGREQWGGKRCLGNGRREGRMSEQ
eukprot:3940146-Rhodomonas_salina.1